MEGPRRQRVVVDHYHHFRVDEAIMLFIELIGRFLMYTQLIVFCKSFGSVLSVINHITAAN